MLPEVSTHHYAVQIHTGRMHDPFPRRRRKCCACCTPLCIYQSLASICAGIAILSCVVQYAFYVVVAKNFQWGVIRNFQCYINILLCVAVICAQVWRKAWLYLPFLQFNAAAFFYNLTRFVMQNLKSGHLESWSYYAIYGSQYLTTIALWLVVLAAYLATKQYKRRRRSKDGCVGRTRSPATAVAPIKPQSPAHNGPTVVTVNGQVTP